eukprot:6191860-Pleurochrysis_carterae.AAC.6
MAIPKAARVEIAAFNGNAIRKQKRLKACEHVICDHCIRPCAACMADDGALAQMDGRRGEGGRERAAGAGGQAQARE